MPRSVLGRDTPPRVDGKRPNLLPSRVRQMAQVEAAWVGAFIEADGSAFWKSNPIHRPIVTLVNTDPEVISTVLRFTGAGSVSRNGGRQWPGGKPVYAWSVQRYHEVEDIVDQCAPFSMKLQALLS